MKIFHKFIQFKICFILPFCLIGIASHKALPSDYLIVSDFIMFTIATALCMRYFDDVRRRRIVLIAALVFWCSQLAFHYGQHTLDVMLTIAFNLIVLQIARLTTSAQEPEIK